MASGRFFFKPSKGSIELATVFSVASILASLVQKKKSVSNFNVGFASCILKKFSMEQTIIELSSIRSTLFNFKKYAFALVSKIDSLKKAASLCKEKGISLCEVDLYTRKHYRDSLTLWSREYETEWSPKIKF